MTDPGTSQRSQGLHSEGSGRRPARAATWLRLVAILLLPLVVARCNAHPPGDADDQWRPKGINAANLAAMVVNPADLTHGHGDPGPDRKLSARAVTELWANPVAPLISGASSGGGASGSGSQGGGASGGGASAGGGSGS